MAPKVRKASSDGFSKSDYEVAEILSQLPDLVAKYESIRFDNVYWGCKRTRTARTSIRLTAAMEENGTFASSPDTPLGFWPNGPKEKLNHIKRKPALKRRREDLSAELVNLNLERESLMAELLKLSFQRDELKVINTELKAKERKSSVGDGKEKTHVDIEMKNSAVETSEIPEDNQTIECQQDHPPSNEHQTAETSAEKPHSSSGQSIAFFDLNALPEEYAGMESWASLGIVDRSISRMMAAEARQHRLKIRRVRNPIARRKSQCISR